MSVPFSWPVRIYWEDTDAGGVVFYANYLKFFERARTEWLRTLGFSQQQMLRDDGVMFVVADTALRYRRAARLDDLLDVTGTQEETGKAVKSDARKMTFVSFSGVDGARELALELCRTAAGALAPFGRRAAHLSELAEFVAQRRL